MSELSGVEDLPEPTGSRHISFQADNQNSTSLLLHHTELMEDEDAELETDSESGILITANYSGFSFSHDDPYLEDNSATSFPTGLFWVTRLLLVIGCLSYLLRLQEIRPYVEVLAQKLGYRGSKDPALKFVTHCVIVSYLIITFCIFIFGRMALTSASRFAVNGYTQAKWELSRLTQEWVLLLCFAANTTVGMYDALFAFQTRSNWIRDGEYTSMDILLYDLSDALLSLAEIYLSVKVLSIMIFARSLVAHSNAVTIVRNLLLVFAFLDCIRPVIDYAALSNLYENVMGPQNQGPLKVMWPGVTIFWALCYVRLKSLQYTLGAKNRLQHSTQLMLPYKFVDGTKALVLVVLLCCAYSVHLIEINSEQDYNVALSVKLIIWAAVGLKCVWVLIRVEKIFPAITVESKAIIAFSFTASCLQITATLCALKPDFCHHDMIPVQRSMLFVYLELGCSLFFIWSQAILLLFRKKSDPLQCLMNDTWVPLLYGINMLDLFEWHTYHVTQLVFLSHLADEQEGVISTVQRVWIALAWTQTAGRILVSQQYYSWMYSLTGAAQQVPGQQNPNTERIRASGISTGSGQDFRLYSSSNIFHQRPMTVGGNGTSQGISINAEWPEEREDGRSEVS